MGRKSMTGGVTIKDRNRIQFDFKFDGVRYRPTLLKTPSEANLRSAREHLAAIKQRIATGMFRFEEEFPDYRHLRKVVGASGVRTCSQVFDEYIAHCEARLAKNDMAAATLTSYRKALDSIWRPRIGAITFLDIRISTLVKIADSNKRWSKKTYNNTISVLRRAFVFGYRDHPRRLNPAYSLKSSRMGRKDRQTVDPFQIQDAETLLDAIRVDWGEAQGNYVEFRFFTDMRPSEQIALTVRDFDIGHRTLNVSKARVAGIDKDSVSTMFRVYSAWMQGAVESDIDAIKRAMRLDSVAIQANTNSKAVARKARRADSTAIRTAARPSNEAEVAAYSAFGTGFGTSKEVPQPKSLTGNEKRWRRGWDSKTTLKIKMLLENCGLLVPSKPLASPFVPVDSASRRIHRCSTRNTTEWSILRSNDAASRGPSHVRGSGNGNLYSQNRACTHE